MKSIKNILILTILLSFALAQPMGMMNLPFPQMQDGPMHERMEMMITWKLTNDLDLTTEQAEKFFPRMKEHRSNLGKFDNEIITLYKDINKKIEDDKSVSDDEFNEFISKVDKLEKMKIDERNRFFTELDDILDNSQRVKLVRYKHHFTNELREQIRRRPNKRS
jgi:hypothetical protein